MKPGGMRSRFPVTSLIIAALVLSHAGFAQDLPDSEGRLLVLDQAAGAIAVFDVPSHKLLATIPIGAGVREMAVTPDGRKAYVSRSGRQGITVVNLEANKVVKTLAAAGLEEPQGLQVTPDGRWLLVASGGNRRLALIDARKDLLARSLTTAPYRAHLVAMSGGGGQAYIANRGADVLTVVRLPDLRLQRPIKVGSEPGGLAIAPNGRLLVVGLQGSAQAALIDVGTAQVVARLPVGEAPVRVIFAPRSFTALVTNRSSDDITVLDVLNRKVTKTIRVGHRPVDIVTNVGGTRGYVANSESGTVGIFSIPGYQVKEEIRTGGRPGCLAFTAPPSPPKSHRASTLRPGDRG